MQISTNHHRSLPIAFLVLFPLLLCLSPVKVVISKRTCPLEKELAPCRCQSRSKGGVDFTCDRTPLDAIKRSLELMRQTEQTIVYLKLRQCQLGHLPDGTLQNLTVKHLIITNSSLNSIGENAFLTIPATEGSHDTQVETMDLSQNQLPEIPRLALRPLGSLVTLAINHNSIDQIPAEAFKGLTSLLRLSLFGNRISKMDSNAFRGVERSLARLNLGSNQLTLIPTEAIRGLANLEWLELQDNRITQISKEHFQGLHKLDVIDLTNNLIEELPSESFGDGIGLNSLTLEGNLISNIQDDAFHGVQGTLEWLKLGDNRLDQIPSHALRRLSKLKQLDMHNNNISFIPEDAFEEFGTHLKYLGLRKNNIQKIPGMAFFNMHKLQWLYLGENQLKRLPAETYEPIIDTLNNLDVHNNPLICDCELRWFGEWLANDGRKVLTFAEDTHCHEPAMYYHLTLSSVPPNHMTCPMYQSDNRAADATTIYQLRWWPLAVLFETMLASLFT